MGTVSLTIGDIDSAQPNACSDALGALTDDLNAAVGNHLVPLAQAMNATCDPAELATPEARLAALVDLLACAAVMMLWSATVDLMQVYNSERPTGDAVLALLTAKITNNLKVGSMASDYVGGALPASQSLETEQ